MLNPVELCHCMCLMTGTFPHLVLDKQVDAIFVWGRAADEWTTTKYDDGILALAASLHASTSATIVIPGYTGSEKGQGEYGYPGPSVWRAALRTQVQDRFINQTSGDGFNTKTEMDDFLEMAVEKGWSTVLGVTQQSHALRAMLGTVKSLADRQLDDITVAPIWPTVFNWSRACYGSQGQGPHPRIDWVDAEYERIERYQRQGDLSTLQELRSYLKNIYRQS